MQATFGGTGSIGDILLPGLDTMLAGYMTLDHDVVQYGLDGSLHNSAFLATTLVTLLNQVDNFPTQVGSLDPSQYMGFPNAFSPTADPDGDGYSNEQEFAYFQMDGQEAFAAAALDPTQTPKRGDGLFQAGDSTRLPLLVHPAWDWNPSRPYQFQWYRNGQPLSDGANVSGSHRRCLILSPLDVADAGMYTCNYQTATGSGVNRAYTDHIYGPVSVRVGEKVPVATPFGLALLAGAAGLGGVSALRRRRRQK